MIKFFSWLIVSLIVIILMWTILGDITPVTFGLSEDMPQKWVASVFFIVGALLGWLLMLPKNLALRWTARKLRKENVQMKANLDKPIDANSTLDDTSADMPPLTM